MFRNLKRPLLFVGTGGLCSLAVFGWLVHGAQAASPPPAQFALGFSWKGTLPRDIGKTYSFTLQAGQILHLAALQQGADVALVVLHPTSKKDRKLFKVDRPIGNQGTEHVFVFAQSKGRYGVRIEDGSRGKYRGDYLLRVEELRKASEWDRKNAEAEKAYYVGEELAGKAAETAYSKAVEHWRELKHTSRLADALERLGAIRLSRADWQGAVAAYQECITLRSSLTDRPGKAKALSRMALAHEAMGKLQQAEASYSQELEIWTSLNNRARRIRALYDLARMQREIGELEDALAHFTEVILADEESRSTDLQIKSLGGRGATYNDMGRPDLALDDFERALSLLKVKPNLGDEAALLTQKASVFQDQGRLGEAAGFLRKALVLRRADRNPSGEAVTLSSLGVLHYKSERLSEALDAFNRAAQIFASERAVVNQVASMTNLGWIHAVQDRPEIAMRIFNQALSLARGGGNKPAEARILYGMAFAERKRGSPITARDRIEKAIGIMESLRSKTERRDLRASYLASREDLYGFKIELLMDLRLLQPRAGHDIQAFQTSERARARGLYEALADRHEPEGHRLAPNLLERRRRTREAINKLDLELRRSDLSESKRRQKEVLLRNLISQSEELEAAFRASSGRWAGSPPSPSLWEIQKKVLDGETILLAYYLSKSRSFLWAVTPATFRGYELGCPDLRDLAGKVSRLLAAGKTVSPEAWERLSRCALGPVTGLLRNKRILVVAHDELQKIPFAALTDLAEQNTQATAKGVRQVLALDHEVINVPSISVLKELRRQWTDRSPARNFLALVADPVYSLTDDRLTKAARETAGRSSHLEPLPYDFSRLLGTREEARKILSLARGRASKVALGFDATREWVLQGHLEDAQVVHFGTHGILNETYPELSGLVLSQLHSAGHWRDGLLRSHEIDDLNLAADLVVLSACQTALGKDVRGEGLVGLTQSFLMGGASAVLVSLWKVDDRATAELMKHFYEYLIGHSFSPPAALKYAQARMMEAEHWRAPYYWSGFILQGDWEVREALRSKSRR